MSEKSNSLSRRSFLRLTGMATLAAAGAATAGCTTQTQENVPGGAIKFAKETDVLVVGAGMSGLWAAFALAKAGVKAIVVEKNPSFGGDGMLAEGVIGVFGTVVQKKAGLPVPTPEQAWEAAKARFAQSKYQELQKMIYMVAPSVIQIWTEELGIEWMDMKTPGWNPMFHVHKDGLHHVDKLMKPLYDFSKGKGIEYSFETRAQSMIINDKNEVVGLRVRDEVSGKSIDIKAKKIIIATGDYVSNQEIVAKYAPKFSRTAILTPNSMGDGHMMGAAVGGNLINMGGVVALGGDFVPVTTHGIVDSIISLSPDGKRIGSEMNFMGAPLETVNKGWGIFWTIYDDKAKNGVFKYTYDEKDRIGGVIKANTIEELAALTFMPLENLKATIEKFNADAKNGGQDTVFKKPIPIKPIEAPYYAVKSTVVRYKASGGLAVNDKLQVLDKAEKPIANLYAVGGAQGEISINIHQAAAMGLFAGEVVAKEITKK